VIAFYVPCSVFAKWLELIPNVSVTNTHNFFGELSCPPCKKCIFFGNDPSAFSAEKLGTYFYIQILVQSISYYTCDISVVGKEWCC
jgi:hypothetical protein